MLIWMTNKHKIWGGLTDISAGLKTLLFVFWTFTHWCRPVNLLNRNIVKVTPKIIHFCYQKIYFKDQSIQKKHLIWFWKKLHWCRQQARPGGRRHDPYHSYICHTKAQETAAQRSMVRPHEWFCFQNWIKYFSDTLIQILVFFYIMNINDFRGDLTNISATKEPLGHTHSFLIESAFQIQHRTHT